MVKHQKNNSALYYEFCILRILLKNGIINQKAFDCLCQHKSLAFGPRKVVHLPRPERF